MKKKSLLNRGYINEIIPILYLDNLNIIWLIREGKRITLFYGKKATQKLFIIYLLDYTLHSRPCRSHRVVSFLCRSERV